MIVRIKYFLFLYLFFVCKTDAQSITNNTRIVVNENAGWGFVKDSTKTFDVLKTAAVKWANVDLPHTWNVTDILDDIPGYYRGVGWYKKTINVDASLKNKKLFLYFEGVGQEAEIFINGKKAGSHTGSYAAFCIPISSFINTSGTNEILVKVDNSYNENIAPLSADFTFYGGIYRSVSLIATDEGLHFSMNDNASKSVFISTPIVTAKKAQVTIKGSFTNEDTIPKRVKIVATVKDESGNTVASFTNMLVGVGNVNGEFGFDLPEIKSPKLWSPENPYLYTVVTQILQPNTNAVLDEVKNKIGFRWFSFDAGKGFFLNGKSYKLIGMSRHQDFKGMGNAVPKNVAVQDVAFIKKSGSNFFRIAHYPQDPAILEACDSIGLLTSVEIPVVNEITESETFYQNCKNMLVEMIRQNYNHPSIIIWCYMNEILLRPHFTNDKERQKIYFGAITKLAQSLDSITRKEDPYRYTMIANHADFTKYNDNKLTTIAMITGWNLYSGWYSGKQEDFPAFLDRHHEKLPNQPFLITEYGADADSRIRSVAPLRFDKSVEYTTKFHQFYITEIMKRPFVAGSVVWNLADFNSETRTETMPHINNKGLLTWDRIPKDPYYLYQAAFVKEPFIKITSCNWKIRGGVADSSGAFCYQPLQVATNLNSVSLQVNGKNISGGKVEHNLAEWNVPFINGKNTIAVSALKNGKLYKDTLSVNFQLQPYAFENKTTSFKDVNILLGAKRYFVDAAQQLWIPDQTYRSGSWGSIGGKSFVIENNTRLPYGTDKNILDTDDDPIYQTQQVGIKEYCFDVPAGKYELSFYFAELQGGVVKYPPYNLNDTARDEDNIKRSFTVTVNNTPFLQNFNMAKEYGISRAIIKKTTVNVQNNTGITIAFKAIEGEPILNALQLKKMD